MKKEERGKESQRKGRKSRKTRHAIAKKRKSKLQAKERESLLGGSELSALCCSSAS